MREKWERGATWESGRVFLQKSTQGEKERRLRQGELSEPSRWIASVLLCSPEVMRCVKEICAQSTARNQEEDFTNPIWGDDDSADESNNTFDEFVGF